MQKITRTTDIRSLDEDLRRLYKRGDDFDAALSALKVPSAAPVSVNPGVITELPSPSGATTVTNVQANSIVGVLPSFAREDHVHEGVQSFRGTVVLGSPSTTLTITHGLKLNTPFLASVEVYSSAGVQQATALAAFVFTTNGVTITFTAPLAADTYSVLAIG